VKFSIVVPKEQTDEQITINPPLISFDFALTVGIGKENGPLVGGVRGKMAGTGKDILY
jgi:hypothetical protein